MKKQLLLFIVPFLLVSCNTRNPIIDEDYEEKLDVIYSLRGKSHNVTFKQDVYVNQTNELSIDTYYGLEAHYTYSYDSSNNNERAFSSSSTARFANLVKGTHNFMTDDDGNELISTSSQPRYTYFRDNDTGTVIAESLGIDNKVHTTIQSSYDSDYGIYTPVVYDDEFRNPFDYIIPNDLTKIDEQTYSLSISKAAFILDCYGAISSSFVEECKLITNNSQIVSIEFKNKLDCGQGYTYSREMTYSVTFDSVSTDALIHHVVPSTNSNPKLQEALNTIKTANSYTYSKELLRDDGELDHIDGYITKDAAFYHHTIDIEGNPVGDDYYKDGDNYDYAAVKHTEDNLFYGYEYVSSGDTWRFNPITISSTAYYTIDDVLGLGPKYYQINASIFSLKEGTDNVYIITDELLSRSIASYFDFQFLGVNSQVLETNTDHFELTLSTDGSFTVDTGYTYSDSGKTVTKQIVYRFDANSINNTVIPSFVTLP